MVLFQKWRKAPTRYYSDLPFILAVSFVIFIYDRTDSVLGLGGIMPITTISQIINLLGFLAIVTINLIIMLVIWMPERKRLRSTFIIAWVALWAVLIGVLMSIVGTPDTIHSIVFMMSIPIMLLLSITWFFCYFQKRLSVIHPLIVGIGFTLFFLTSILRVVVSSIGNPIGYVFTDLTWIVLIVDISAFCIMLLGFTREMKN